jgi:hypothetical protein
MLAQMGVSVLEEVVDGNIEFTQIETLARIRWVPCAVDVENQREAFNRIAATEMTADFLVVEDIYLGRELISDCDPKNKQPAQLEWLDQSPNRLLISSNAPDGGWLVLADSLNYPNWPVKVGDRYVPLYAANLVFRAVPLPIGESQIEFIFDPMSFKVGASLSFIGWLAFAIYWRKLKED